MTEVTFEPLDVGVLQALTMSCLTHATAAEASAERNAELKVRCAKAAAMLSAILDRIAHPGTIAFGIEDELVVTLSALELAALQEAYQLAKDLVLVEQIAESYPDSKYAPAVDHPNSDALASLAVRMQIMLPSKQDREEPGLRPVS